MPITIKKLYRDIYPAWDAYMRRNNGSIYHDSRWIDLIKKVFGHDCYHLVAIEGDNIVGGLPLTQLNSMVFGNFLVSMPYFNYGGIVADSSKVEEKLLQSAQETMNQLHCAHVEIRCNNERQFDLPVKTNKVCVLLDLPDDPEILWKSIGSKRRAQVKRPVREGVDFVYGGIDLIDDFYEVFSRNMRDLGTPVYGKDFFSEILMKFPESASIAVVRLKDKPVGAGFLIGNNGKLEIPWASTLREVNRLGVNMFLYWKILEKAIELDFQVFDFGRSSIDANTLKFKKQWGGKVEQLYWYYLLKNSEKLPDLTTKNKKFELMISFWKKLPVSMTKLIGPHIVKNIP